MQVGGGGPPESYQPIMFLYLSIRVWLRPSGLGSRNV